MERFTARARVVISSAALAARDAGHDRAGAVHILIGLFAEPDGIAARVLQALGVTREAVKAAVQAGAAADGGTAAAAGHADPQAPRFTTDGRLAMRDALAVALELGHNYVGTEHLLLGLYRNQDSPAAGLLVAAGAGEPAARALVADLLRGFTPPQPASDV